MNDKITIQRSSTGVLTLKHSRAAAGVSLAFLTVLVGMLFWMMQQEENEGKMQTVILFGALLVFQISHQFMAFRGLTYSFDPTTRTIRKNKENVADFNEVESIQIRFIENSDGPTDHRLALVLHDDRKICMVQTTDENLVFEAADKVADLLGVPVRKRC